MGLYASKFWRSVKVFKRLKVSLKKNGSCSFFKKQIILLNINHLYINQKVIANNNNNINISALIILLLIFLLSQITAQFNVLFSIISVEH